MLHPRMTKRWVNHYYNKADDDSRLRLFLSMLDESAATAEQCEEFVAKFTYAKDPEPPIRQKTESEGEQVRLPRKERFPSMSTAPTGESSRSTWLPRQRGLVPEPVVTQR